MSGCQGWPGQQQSLSAGIGKENSLWELGQTLAPTHTCLGWKSQLTHLSSSQWAHLL